MSDTTFATLPLAQLQESTTNPRTQFQKLDELAESIKAVGLVQPLTVVKNGKGYIIVAGARRYRAAKLAGLAEVPVTIRTLTPEQILEVQIIENLQREDVHPLDEAAGYDSLMSVSKWTVGQVAAKVGKSEKYVYDRVKLLALCKEAKEAFWANQITAGHAILLARLTTEQQHKAMGLDMAGSHGGLWTAEVYDETPEQRELDEAKAEAGDHYAFENRHRKARSVRELDSWINEHVRFDPAKAEPLLFPETVETLQQAQEAEEKIIPITYNYHVDPEAKDGNRTYGPMSWTRADGTHGSKPCEEAVTGVIVVGPGRGEAFKVCIAKKTCLVHWKKEIQERQKREKAQASGKPAPADKYELQRKREEQERQRQEARREAYRKIQPQVVQLVAAAIKKAPTKSTGLLGTLIVEEVSNRGWGRTAKNPLERGATAEDLVRYAAMQIAVQELANDCRLDDLTKFLKGFNIDLKALMKEPKK